MIRKFGWFCMVIFSVCMFSFNLHADSGACIRLVANDFNATLEKVAEDEVVVVTSDMLVPVFAKYIDTCRDFLLGKTDADDIVFADDELVVDIKWEYLISEVAQELSVHSGERVMFVCENHRSIEVAIETALWTATAISAVASFGTASAAMQGGKIVLVNGVKSMLSVGIKSATRKTAAEKAAKITAEGIAYEAAKAESRKVAADIAGNTIINNAKARLKTAGTRVTTNSLRTEIQKSTSKNKNVALKLLDDKIAARTAQRSAAAAFAKIEEGILAEHGIASAALNKAMKAFAISTPISALGVSGAIYSYMSSELDKNVMNCTNTDKNDGCYTRCDALFGEPTDDLNTKVFKKSLGKYLCVDPETYALREVSTDGLYIQGNVFKTTEAKWNKLQEEIKKSIQDQGNCDWNEDDIDMYVTTPLYSDENLQPINEGNVGLIIGAVRIDD